MKKILLLLSWALLPSILFAQKTNYSIYETKTGKTITVEELVKNIKNVDVLVFGEEHNDSTGHQLEAQIYEKMLQDYPGTALSMEMFCTDVQPVINEYLLDLISEKNFIKETRAWNNYTDYQTLIELAKTNKTDIVGANAATRYSNAVSMSGLQKLAEFPAASRAFLPPLPIDTATGRYHEKFIETLGGHDMGSMKIYQTQNLWDATMGWSIAKYAKLYPKKKILHLNGRFHSDEHIGVITQIKKYAPKLTVANISCFSAATMDDQDKKKYAELGDYVIITNTPAAN
ncbi:ChaN family lipoprotein [Pedobacter sp. L105]|uniref:ChaN family lipoprotein n=1 Tax=Pedobacter sp. L105 TaxID=1641871 RepID=UPI00131BBC49|nr:ChaN family lipoprotein [Pedobacter sp. L105]